MRRCLAWSMGLMLTMLVGGCAGNSTGSAGTGGQSQAGAGGGAGEGQGGTDACPPGDETCPCYPNNTCNGSLVCLSGLCVAPGGGGSGSTAGSGGSAGDGDGGDPSGAGGQSSTGGGASGGGTSCPAGDETCPCYPNDTCNGSLLCESGLCVAPGSGGSGGAEGGSGGSSGAGGGGGAEGGSGGAQGGSGGSAGTSGGSAGGGGTAGSGGASGGSGGASGGSGGGSGGATAPCWPSNYVQGAGIVGWSWGQVAVGGNVVESTMTGGLELAYGLPGTSYDDYALIGFNLDQPNISGTDPRYPIDTSDTTGICIEGSGFDRIQLMNEAEDIWCVDRTGCVPWGDFTRDCWEEGGEALALGTAIVLAVAQQPSRYNDGTATVGTLCVSAARLY